MGNFDHEVVLALETGVHVVPLALFTLVHDEVALFTLVHAVDGFDTFVHDVGMLIIKSAYV